jgi:hypothetical protein
MGALAPVSFNLGDDTLFLVDLLFYSMSRIPHGQGGRCMLFLQDHRPRLCSQASVAERPIALPPVRLEERPMAQLHFTCPATRHRAATGIQIDVQSLRASWHSTLKVNCPHCGGQHDIAVRDTYGHLEK